MLWKSSLSFITAGKVENRYCYTSLVTNWASSEPIERGQIGRVWEMEHTNWWDRSDRDCSINAHNFPLLEKKGQKAQIVGEISWGLLGKQNLP